MSKPKTVQTDAVLPREEAARLIRELAVKPPVKGMANVKAATDVFEANRRTEDVDLGHRLPAGSMDAERKS